MESGLTFIYTDTNFNEIGQITKASLDFDIGLSDYSANDFQVLFDIEDFPKNTGLQEGSLIYANLTEFGGMITSIKASSIAGTVTLEGKTWRGKLMDLRVQPPEGQNWYTISGNANTETEKLIKPDLGEFYFLNPDTTTDIEISNDIRDVEILKAIEEALSKGNEDGVLVLYFDREQKKVIYNIEAGRDLSLLYHFGETLTTRTSAEKRMDFYTRVLALGAGEGASQIRVMLYRFSENGWSMYPENEKWKGILINELIYENSASETTGDLYLQAFNHVRSLKEGEVGTSEVIIEGDDLRLGDIVDVTEEITETKITGKIANKILKITIDGENTDLSVEYKVAESL